MAIKDKAREITLLASADLTSSQYYFVARSSDNRVALATSGGIETEKYILQNKPASGEEAACAVLGSGQSKLFIVDATAALGADLTCSSGTAGAGTARAGVGILALATVDEAATTSGDIIIVNTINGGWRTT